MQCLEVRERDNLKRVELEIRRIDQRATARNRRHSGNGGGVRAGGRAARNARQCEQTYAALRCCWRARAASRSWRRRPARRREPAARSTGRFSSRRGSSAQSGAAARPAAAARCAARLTARPLGRARAERTRAAARRACWRRVGAGADWWAREPRGRRSRASSGQAAARPPGPRAS